MYEAELYLRILALHTTANYSSQIGYQSKKVYHFKMRGKAIQLPAAALLLLVGVEAMSSVTCKTIPNKNKLPQSLLGSNHPMKFEFLGTVDGKSYYADSDVNMEWRIASDYCQAFDMALATIESENEWNFLLEATSDFPESRYWTAGREYQSPLRYAWNGTLSPLDPAVITRWNNEIVGDGFSNCVTLFVNPYVYYPTTEDYGQETEDYGQETTASSDYEVQEKGQQLEKRDGQMVQHTAASHNTAMYPEYCGTNLRVLCQGTLTC